MTTCPECGEPGGAHAATCSLAAFEDARPGVPRPAAPDAHGALLESLRDEVRLLRKMVAFGLVLLVLWMLVWAVLNG